MTAYIGECCDLVLSGKEGVGVGCLRSIFPIEFSRYNVKLYTVLITMTYSRVHKSSDSFFSKILEKPSIVQKKMILHIKGLDFSQR